MTPDKLSLGVAQPVTKRPKKRKRYSASKRRQRQSVFSKRVLRLDPVCRACGKKSLSLHTMLYILVMAVETLSRMVLVSVDYMERAKDATMLLITGQPSTAFGIRLVNGYL